MKSSCEALFKSKELKEEGNKLFRTKAYKLDVNIYDNSLQYMCVFVPENENHAKLMEELGIAINLNIAVCWLKLNEFELAKHQCNLVIKVDLFNVKARFRRAQTLIHLGLKEEARQYLPVTIRFDPNKGS